MICADKSREPHEISCGQVSDLVYINPLNLLISAPLAPGTQSERDDSVEIRHMASEVCAVLYSILLELIPSQTLLPAWFCSAIYLYNA